MSTSAKTCELPACDEAAQIRGFCNRHYDKLRRTRYLPIVFKTVDSTPMRHRITAHLQRGHCLKTIADSAGVNPDALRKAYRQGTPVLITTARRVMAVPLPPQPPSITGIRRRLEALARIGYSLRRFTKVSGICRSTLSRGLRADHFTVEFRLRLVAAYEKLSATPVDDPMEIARAKKNRYFAPADWEYVDIDDPNAWPDYLDQQGNEDNPGTWAYTELPHDQCVELLVQGEFYDNVEGRPLRAAKLAAVVELAEQGWTGRRIAAWLRMTPRTVRNMRAESKGERPAPQLPPAELHCRSVDRHPFSPSNTRIDSRGRRHCRTCETRSTRARRAKARKIAA
jgi:lambda repressor-like predicted transcriptional regulator